MPVCLKCGKEIEPGSNFCENCGVLGEQEVRELLSGQQSEYRVLRQHNTVWFIIIAVLLFSIVAGLGYGLLSMIPNSKKIKAEAQANICHRDLQKLQDAVDKYYEDSKQNPPPGRVSPQSVLVTDLYINSAPTCPTTGHYYVIKRTASGPYTVYCDSGLPGHKL